MSLDDEFIVKETDALHIEVQKKLTLRFADVHVTPKNGESFDMMLFFKCDTRDLALFNTPTKIQESVLQSSQKYLPYVVEDKVKLENINWKDQYGSYTILTDSKFVGAEKAPAGHYKYLTRGMVRLSKDSALGFSIMTNEIHTEINDKLFTYIKKFMKTDN